MATIANLKQSISILPYEEALALIMTIRSERRKPKGKFVRQRSANAAAKSAPKQKKLANLLSQLSPEQIAQLMEELDG